MRNVVLICSNRPRPTLQKAGKGSQFWVRDVHHISNESCGTLCGRWAGDYLVIQTMPVAEALKDHNLCEKCRKKVN